MCGRRLLLAAIIIMKRLLTFTIFIHTCIAIIGNLFVQRQMTGDLYRYNHGKLTECWINKTFVSRNSSSVECSKLDEISECVYGHRESNLFGLPISIKKQLCPNIPLISRVDVWDLAGSTGVWRQTTDEDVIKNLKLEDDSLIVTHNENINWGGQLLKVWMKCEEINQCVVIKFYGATYYPLPATNILRLRKDIIIDSPTTTTTTTIKKLGQGKPITRENSDITESTNNKRDLFPMLYFILVAFCLLFLTIIVGSKIILVIRKRKKRQMYPMSKYTDQNEFYDPRLQEQYCAQLPSFWENEAIPLPTHCFERRDYLMQDFSDTHSKDNASLISENRVKICESDFCNLSDHENKDNEDLCDFPFLHESNVDDFDSEEFKKQDYKGETPAHQSKVKYKDESEMVASENNEEKLHDVAIYHDSMIDEISLNDALTQYYVKEIKVDTSEDSKDDKTDKVIFKNSDENLNDMPICHDSMIDRINLDNAIEDKYEIGNIGKCMDHEIAYTFNS